ncbi:hypothetical protein SLA2020_511970 [Shorea laevis]
MPTKKDQESGMLEELPVGVRVDEQAIPELKKYEELEMIEDVASQSGERESNMINDAAFPIDEVSTISKANKQLQKAKLGKWMKVQEEYVISNDEFTMVHKPNEVSLGEESADKLLEANGDYKEILVDNMPSSHSANGDVVTQEKEVIFKENKEDNVH